MKDVCDSGFPSYPVFFNPAQTINWSLKKKYLNFVGMKQEPHIIYLGLMGKFEHNK